MALSSRIRKILFAAGVVATVMAGGIVVSQAAAMQDAATAQAATEQAAQAAAKDAAAREQEAAKRAMELSRYAGEQARAAEANGARGVQSTSSTNPLSASPIVSVEFPGGTVQEYVQLLRGTTKDPVNIAASEELLSTQIPPITLKNVALMSALRALGTIGDGAGMIDVRDLSLLSKTGERAGSPVYEVLWVPRRMSDEASVQTYALFERLPVVNDEEATRMAETLVSAAQTALQMSGNSSTWELKFHRPSRLLLVKGTKGQIEIVASVVERMTSSWAREAFQKSSDKGDTAAMDRLARMKDELSKDVEAHRRQMEEFMQVYEARAAEAKKNGVAVPEMGQVEKLRYSALQDTYNAKLQRLSHLDDQLLNARLGFGNAGSQDARLNALEARLNDMAAYLEKRMGFGK